MVPVPSSSGGLSPEDVFCHFPEFLYRIKFLLPMVTTGLMIHPSLTGCLPIPVPLPCSEIPVRICLVAAFGGTQRKPQKVWNGGWGTGWVRLDSNPSSNEGFEPRKREPQPPVLACISGRRTRVISQGEEIQEAGSSCSPAGGGKVSSVSRAGQRLVARLLAACVN